MDPGEGEDAFVFAQVAPRFEVGWVEFEAAEGAHRAVPGGGDVFDGEGRSSVDGMGELADIAIGAAPVQSSRMVPSPGSRVRNGRGSSPGGGTWRAASATDVPKVRIGAM
ncbi:hypothetical protein GCM10014713_14110 [Streptomyces purpureus]|uniref:Uncharacterized protein n=1 Tax=Streptomyces purpureus TaxID=1951 RepID=A0A918GY62_9ACTN|nr:hypothetical protein GCM10014713_14110 [Streptomyces purpureus]